MTTTPLEDFAARDGDLEGTNPAPFEQRDLGPIVREQERLVAQIAEVTDVTEPDPATWEDVRVIARLAANGMSVQADEHAVELHRAWERGRAAGARPTPTPIYGDDDHDRRQPTNPYPETTPASTPVTIDGVSLTWHQLPGYVATLHAKIRALAEVQS